MAKKKRNDYFELLTNQAQFCVEAAELLEQSLCAFDADQITPVYEQMHQIEHNADELHHDILTKLYAEFITPIDQEDILRLVQIIDDVTDALDEVMLDFYMYHVTVLPQGADAFAKLVANCVKSLYAAIAELKNFKKPEQLSAHIAALNQAETEADRVYGESIHTLFVSDVDSKTLFGSSKIFDRLERCCDLCEHAADTIEQIIIKNT